MLTSTHQAIYFALLVVAMTFSLPWTPAGLPSRASGATPNMAPVAISAAPVVPTDGASNEGSNPVGRDSLLSESGAMRDGGAVMMLPTMRRILAKKDSLWERALRLHYDAIVVDGHVDTPTLMLDRGYDMGARHSSRTAHVDLPRMYEGGLDATFFALYVAPGYGESEQALRRASNMIQEVQRQLEARPDSVALVLSADELVRVTREGRKAILLGLEGGHAIGGSPDALRDLYQRGVRYVTLTHINSNSFADASQSRPRWNGLNEKGRRIVREMNRLGMIVDVSHASDSTFFDALKESTAPILLSHSSVRALSSSVRNASDDMLRALAERNGLIMINFFDALVNPHVTDEFMDEVLRRLPGGSLVNLWNGVYDLKSERGLPGAHLTHVVDHIDHAVRVAGVDHVGLGSDFDGVFDLPAGLDDVTRLPWITYELLKRGYSETEVRKLLGGNLIRLLHGVEQEAARLQRIEAGATSSRR